MSPTGNYLNAITNRRTIYNLKPELPQGVGLDDVKRSVHVILKNTPTAFNSQVNRAVIIVGDTHKRIWDAVASAMPTAEAKKRPESCRDEAYGSVIFFTDEGPTEKLQRDFPALAAAFPTCAAHTTGAVQIQSWTALELLGLGANLQHYNDYVKSALPQDVPIAWTVQSQLVFGVPTALPEEKTFINNVINVYH